MGYLTHRPARGNINTPFGPRPKPTPSSPAIHYGQDYGWGGGDVVSAARGGRVKSYGYSGAYGNRLVIDHGNGHETWYCHLTRNSVAVDTEVRGGQEVGIMGDTGNVVGKHLHFELRINGVAVDPAPHFNNTNPAGIGVDPSLEDDMAEEASVQESIRIGNVNYAQLQEVKGLLQAAALRDASDATEASVQEAIRIGNVSFGIIENIAAKPSSVIDVNKLAAALTAAGIKVTVDMPALVGMIDKSLADNFAAIPAAVNKDAAARLAS